MHYLQTQQVHALGQNLSKTINSLMTLRYDMSMTSSCGFRYRSMSVVELPVFVQFDLTLHKEKF